MDGLRGQRRAAGPRRRTTTSTWRTSLRIPLPLSACFLIVPLCTLVQTVPISFNGWGMRESVFILYFAQLGLPRESALAFSLVGAGLMVLLSLSGAVVWTSRGDARAGRAGRPGD